MLIHNDCFKRIKWLVFSDTILVTLTCIDDKDEPALQKGIDWLCFIPIMNALYCHLFDKGLPIRGAITFGKYLIINHCFAGRAILDAYRVGQSLDLSAITFHQNALAEIKKQMLDKDELLLNNYTVKYLTPLRQKVEEQQLLTPLRQKVEEQQLLLPSLFGLRKINNSDVRQLIANSFQQHNKCITSKAVSKLDNTEHFFRFCQAYLHKCGNDSDQPEL